MASATMIAAESGVKSATSIKSNVLFPGVLFVTRSDGAAPRTGSSCWQGNRVKAIALLFLALRRRAACAPFVASVLSPK